ncbi:MAG: response regulator [Bryobacteraceae bacterium]|jgi:signal transduction histidine kinase/CheY-like chemotaxis protein
MRAFRDVSIKRKLIGIIMLTSTVALLLACSTFLAYELITYRETATRRLSTVAQIIAENSTAALAFDDRRSAGETLAALRADLRMVSACIYTKDGRPFAAFLRGESRRDLPRRPGNEGVEFRNHHMLLFRRITFDGEWIGTLYLNRDLQDIYMRLERYAGIVLAVLLASSLAAFLLSSSLQRVISEPVLRLAEMASRVSAERIYSLRAVKIGDDEIGALVDRFNEMMAQIQAHSVALDQAQSALQQHVEELCVEIAERQRIEEELLAAKQAAEESNRAKSDFLANMSHELRTPLNAIIGYGEMLREEAEEGENTKLVSDLARITSAGKHLLMLINDVLDLSKVEAGKAELSFEDASIPQILEEAANTMEPLLRKNGNRLILHNGAGPHSMRVDLLKFRQSLYNLLSNACKFTKNGDITLAVLPVTENGTDWIEWRVSDTGIGIAADQLHKLFRSFSQVDASTTRNYGGTGLGLAISQRLCQLMGGRITVVSEPGKGSTFTMRLPYPDRMPALESAPKTAMPAGSKPRPNTVLVIDDDPTVHDLMQRCLPKEGFDVALASSGEEGLRKAAQLCPAIIALDVFLPGMDGWSVLSALKADPKLAAIPVVLHTISDDRGLAYRLGAAEYLRKPVAPERFAAVLQKFQPDRLAGPVLLVDDDPAARELTARVLKKHFHHVVEAGDGRAALRRIARQKPGLIVLDLVMPGMDGFDFVAALSQHEDWRDIPIVVLTAKDLSPEEQVRLNGSVRRILKKGDLAGGGLARIAAGLTPSPLRIDPDRPAAEEVR